MAINPLGQVDPDVERILERADEEPARMRQVGGRHYSGKSLQPWDVMESWFTPEEFRGYLRGNILKYTARYRDKGGVQDLRKARHYLDRLIELEESQSTS